ncbi:MULTISPECIES: J domain-containing protein [Rhodomicrobium]|uniref:DnaJ C-terminal domain-containing protein n=1 Tax=Rhodomicrobium TaxID=1068 RepID=UPI000B4AEF08|nr:MULTISPECIES: J domain-containing protein [Rhodomicrobium]
MDQDLYQILNVKRAATHDEIRGAYRKLAKEFHPDRNPGNAAAEEKFKRVSAAFDILGDPDKRRRYDNGEIDASGRESSGYYGDNGGGQRYRPSDNFGDFGDIFGDFFGRGGTGTASGGFNMRGMDYRYHLEIEFLEAVNGVKKRVLLPEGETLDINVPSGVVQGQVLRLKGKGGPGVGRGQPGDALIELKIRQHPFFEREGDDIVLDLPIALYEAVLGAKVEAPTINGRVALTVPKGASTGQLLRLRAKGVRNAQTGNTGDQLVKLCIVMPQRIDRELFDFMEGWSELHPYDPRSKLKEAI